MAPAVGDLDLQVTKPWRRAVQDDAQNEADFTNSSTYVAVGVTAGGILVLVAVFLLVKIVRKRRTHKRAMEVPEAQSTDHAQIMQQAVRPMAHLWNPLTNQASRASAGWGSILPNETLDRGHSSEARRHRSLRLPRRLKPSTIRPKPIKHLSAIVEDFPSTQASKLTTRQPSRPSSGHCVEVDPLSARIEEDVSENRPPAVHGICFDSGAPGTHPTRAVSIDIAQDAPHYYKRLSRPLLHARSFSLGAPPTKPPSGPVPTIPVPRSNACPASSHKKLDITGYRLSSESAKSTGSSVLVTSPLVVRDQHRIESRSPHLEPIVANDGQVRTEDASERPLRPAINTKSRAADQLDLLHGCDLSTQSEPGRLTRPLESRPSCSAHDSGHRDEHRLSIPKIGTAERVSISRLSSASSLKSVETSTPPRRKSPANRRVSHNGSPIERKRSIGLREISPNTMTPSRQPSVTTQDSTHSSNGNPFQWDQNIVNKPSAMKGSPKARKGHRRQNCIRISTLTPQVLGPPPSRTDSPSIMHGIQEEGIDHDDSPIQMRFVTNHRLERPASSGSFRDDLRIQALRASLTPSSPTLSMWAASQDNGLPCNNSPRSSRLSATRSPTQRSASQSPTRRLPAYPAPGKPTLSDKLHGESIAQFCISRPSTEMDCRDLETSWSGVDIPSSPPLPVSKEQPYDPAWSLPAPPREYHPASPQWKAGSSSIARAHPTGSGVSPSGQSSTAPCSPASMFNFDRIDSRKAALDILTSANASILMAKMSPPKVDFPGAPALSPGLQDLSSLPDSSSSARRKVVIRPSLPDMSSDVSVVPSDVSIPSPLHIRSVSLQYSPASEHNSQSPRGPRAPPAKSVLSQALDLRRMNSATDDTRWSQRDLCMGAEASPTVPWMANLQTPRDESSVVDPDGSEASSIEEADSQSNWRGVRFGILEYGSSPPVMPFQIDNRSTEEVDVFVDSPSKNGLPQFEFPSPSQARTGVLPRNDSLARWSPSAAGTTKHKKKSSPRQAARMGAPKGILKKIPVFFAESTDLQQEGDNKENEDRGSHLGVLSTPVRAKSRGSLYDSDGFLRS